MSSFIFENGNIISFRDYLLSESIKSKIISYGTNYKEYDNKKIENINSIKLTSFIFEDKVYTIIIDNSNSVGFHFSELPDKEIDYFEIIKVDTSGKAVRNSSSAIKVFSYVFYVILEIADKFNLKELKFSAEHLSLGKVYDNLVKNKFFIDELKSKNFNFIGKKDDEYIFLRN